MPVLATQVPGGCLVYVQLGMQLGKQLGKQLGDTTCFDFCLSSPPRTLEFVCIGLMSVMEGMTAAMALTNATVLAKKGFAQV